LSSHNYETVPDSETLSGIHSRCVASGADIVKIAAMVTDITHVSRLEQLLRDTKQSQAESTIVLGMGEAGQTSRLLAAKFGSFLTFGALRVGAESGTAFGLYRIPRQFGPIITTVCSYILRSTPILKTDKFLSQPQRPASPRSRSCAICTGYRLRLQQQK
jgi:hypothetical protein